LKKLRKILTLVTALFALLCQTRSQVVLNEIYTDPGAGKHEFFELYNSSTSNASLSVNNLTLVTYFDISGVKGFYVMDLPNMSVAARSFFVGSSAIPFNYQGVTNSTASDFSWNSAAFTANQGSIKKWVQGVANALDGNLFYDQVAIPANFNDFLFRRTGTGASYTMFLYKDGQLVNGFAGGTGGNNSIISDIINMPALFVDMSGTSPDFTIVFSGYSSTPIEYCNNDAGNDNGFIREFDGACATWDKSSSGKQHTPRVTNGTLIGISSGTVSVAVSIRQGISTFGSVIHTDVVSAPVNYFPIELQIYKDLGTTWGQLDANDPYFKSNTEFTVNDGPFYDLFFPSDANMLVAVKTSAGCYDKILWVTNTIVLSVQMISLTGNRSGDNINLNWNVAANEMASHYEVQRSTDGINFTTIGSVNAGSQIGNQSFVYNTTDQNTERSFYRLRIFNKSGQVEYSSIVSFNKNNSNKNIVTILNNPVSDKLSLSITSHNEHSLKLRVMDISGRTVLQTHLNAANGNTQISVPLLSGMNKGTYIVELTGASLKYTGKFVKQ